MNNNEIEAVLSTMRDRGAVFVTAKTCFDEGGKWRRRYPLAGDLSEVAPLIFCAESSTEVGFLDADDEFMDDSDAWG
jgi:hypothetical protein